MTLFKLYGTSKTLPVAAIKYAAQTKTTFISKNEAQTKKTNRVLKEKTTTTVKKDVKYKK